MKRASRGIRVLLLLAVTVLARQRGYSSSPPQTSPPPAPRYEARNNTLLSLAGTPKLLLTLDRRFEYLGSFPFDIQGIAGGYRYVWGETDRAKHLRRVFIVQAEGFYAGNNEVYRYGTPNPVVLAGDAYQHNVWIYDNDASARERPGNESDLTRKFMQEHGYTWEPQLVMSRFGRIVGEAKKDEIIFFYFENLKDHTPKSATEFPEEAKTEEQKAILAAVDSNSRKAFVVEH